MAERSQYEELSRHLSGIGAVKREMSRGLPPECPPASAAVLSLLAKYGEMRASRLSELMAIDMSVTSRHVAHVAEHGWIGRHPDPQDGRSRLLRITPQGQQLLNELSEGVTEALAHYLHDWSDDDVAQLNALLERLRTSFGDCRTRAPQDLPRQTADPARPPTREAGQQTTAQN
ncbi:MarR family winged helix-turn-helix transcriptional regulator [Streptomyces sp. HNM0574]|uniref:MarR family winged helix-turn-helix transcriptional regulator n=1 Tax=Streptomyces sp. HNM0574 TaxID=2714954 RepID=UPI00146C7E19|nr:MarR family winged helix-turn-helix transcriptional regulator [Streptomyces sp. HNM0574]NLU67805.1 winged helix-turn-helix transcriptional regulator [Streptomyces sp. HNM0574]